LRSPVVERSSPLIFGDDDLCALDPDLLIAVLPADAIPALTLPNMVSVGAEGAEYLFDFDRVLGVVVNGEARAYPHNILWYHEIVNDRIGDTWISVTFCPLTGLGLVFDPFVDGNLLELGVSGLLFAELGGTLVGPLGGKIVLDAIAGSNGSIQGVNVSNDEREIVYLQPTVNYQITPSFLMEVAARVPLRGQNFPAGPQFMVAVFHRPAGGN
jgi:hypothetical protein|tara:strand:+ start:71 stop:709 length:639 start_codon:yes stop_codon:yes gene_type:complete